MNHIPIHTAQPEPRRLLVAAEDDTGTLIKILNLLLQHGHVLHALDARVAEGRFRIDMELCPSLGLAMEITAEKMRSLIGVSAVTLDQPLAAVADRCCRVTVG